MKGPTIRLAAAVILPDDGRTLLARKRGAEAFMQAGGKIEPGETAIAALAREMFEAHGVTIDPADARYPGRFRAPAANKAGRTIDATLAPLTRDHVLPLARRLAMEAAG